MSFNIGDKVTWFAVGAHLAKIYGPGPFTVSKVIIEATQITPTHQGPTTHTVYVKELGSNGFYSALYKLASPTAQNTTPTKPVFKGSFNNTSSGIGNKSTAAYQGGAVPTSKFKVGDKVVLSKEGLSMPWSNQFRGGPFTIEKTGLHNVKIKGNKHPNFGIEMFQLAEKREFKVGDKVTWNPKSEHFNRAFGSGPFIIATIKSCGGEIESVRFKELVGSVDVENIIHWDEQEAEVNNPGMKTVLSVVAKKERRNIYLTEVDGFGAPKLDSGYSARTFKLEEGIHDLIQIDKSPIKNCSSASAADRKYLKLSPWLVLRGRRPLTGMPKMLFQQLGIEVLKEEIDIPTKKEAYERNKSSLFCVRCDKRTEKRPVLASLINHCRCVD